MIRAGHDAQHLTRSIASTQT